MPKILLTLLHGEFQCFGKAKNFSFKREALDLLQEGVCEVYFMHMPRSLVGPFAYTGVYGSIKGGDAALVRKEYHYFGKFWASPAVSCVRKSQVLFVNKQLLMLFSSAGDPLVAWAWQLARAWELRATMQALGCVMFQAVSGRFFVILRYEGGVRHPWSLGLAQQLHSQPSNSAAGSVLIVGCLPSILGC